MGLGGGADFELVFGLRFGAGIGPGIGFLNRDWAWQQVLGYCLGKGQVSF